MFTLHQHVEIWLHITEILMPLMDERDVPMRKLIKCPWYLEEYLDPRTAPADVEANWRKAGGIFFKGYEAVAAFFVLWRVRSFEPSTTLYPRVAAANGNVSTLFYLLCSIFQ